MMDCTVCGLTKIKNKEVFQCDGCDSALCKECGELTSSEVRVLQLTNGRTLRFYCSKCLKGESIGVLRELVDSKETIIEDKKEIINILKKEIEELKLKVQQPFQVGQSYSNAVKKQKDKVILIKPKDAKQQSEVTKRTLEEKVDPSCLGVGVSGIKLIRDGGVAIKCNETSTSDSIQAVCNNVKKSMGQEYEVNIPDRVNPKIIVFNVNKKLIEDEKNLLDKMIMQNIIDTDNDKMVIKVVHKYENKRGLVNIVLALDAQSYQCLKKKGAIHIGWKSFYYRDYINVIQCFNCWKYGHFAKNCKGEKPVCKKCAGDHKEKECRSGEVICANCKFAAEVLRIAKIDYNHRVDDRRCEAYKRIVEQLQNRINYPELYPQRLL